MGIHLETCASRHRDSILLPDGPAELVRLPGTLGFSEAHVSLFAAARHLPPGPVLVMGPGAVPTALWVARSGSGLHYAGDSVAESQSLAETLRLNRLPAIEPLHDWAIEPLFCAAALLHLPRGRELQEIYLQTAATHVTPGGRIIFVGAKNEGIRSAVKTATGIYGRAGVVSRKGGFHAAIAYRPERDVTPPRLSPQAYDTVVDDVPTTVVSLPGVFAPDRLDGGAAALIEGMRIGQGASVLDMGCGTGLVALAAARRGGDVVATDVSYRAVVSARHTLQANGYAGVTVAHASGAAPIPDGSLDTVVTNPPFHKGHDVSFEVSQLFVSEAARVLKPDGHLYLVANAFLDYGVWLSRRLNLMEPALENRQFRVWHAIKPHEA